MNLSKKRDFGVNLLFLSCPIEFFICCPEKSGLFYGFVVCDTRLFNYFCIVNQKFMAAPKDNQFWKQRSKHGRDKLFATPELLWEVACEYFAWCDDNPIIKKDVVRSGKNAGDILDIPVQRPYSLSGLLFYVGACESYWRQFKAGEHKDFLTVINDIEKVIETQQFDGATVGIFNSNIIARKLGLVDKTDVTTGGEQVGLKIEVLNENTKAEIEKL